MDLELEDRIAIVTGATGGIGRAIVATLAAEGMSVVVNHLDDGEAADELCAQVRRMDRGAKAFRADVGDREAVEEMIAYAEAEFGGLHLMVHNAGITTRQSIIDTPPADWDRVVRTNYYGAYHTATAAARSMIANRIAGSIVAITSLHGRIAKADMGAYCSTKAAVDMMIKQLAVELAPFDIRANAIAPGTIDTGMNPVYRATDPENVRRRERLLDRVPAARLGAPEAVARAVAFVASPLSDYTTGAVIAVDGGYTADGTPR